ncbi:MAG: lysophospholipid acyltransferase family protein [Methylotenera sp.]|nr:lysophospholipid acyltransferase family protein [Methylotenera sp.]
MQALNTTPLKTNSITRYFRISRIITHTLSGLLIASVLFPCSSQAFKAQLIKWWCRKLLVAFNLRVLSFGHTPNNTTSLSSTMFVANHISWSDIHALNGLVPLRFIAKSEIKNWPIFGYLVSKANTLFIDRNKRQDAKRTIDIAHKSLQAGDNLCFFPEGTTTDGTEIRPFKSSLIQAAILADATVWPVAIRYPNADGSINTKVAYAGETTLVESMQQILFQQQPIVELHFLAPISPAEYAAMDRRALTLHIESLIRHKLML